MAIWGHIQRVGIVISTAAVIGTLALISGCGGSGEDETPTPDQPASAIQTPTPRPTVPPRPSPTVAPTPTAIPTAGVSAASVAVTRAPAPTTTPDLRPTPTRVPVQDSAPLLPTAPTSVPGVIPTPWPTPIPTPIFPQEAYDAISPWAVVVSRPSASGSGLLLPDGYIVTSASLLQPYETADVALPDGRNFENVPTVNSDLLMDLALLGPISVANSPITLSDEIPVSGDQIAVVGHFPDQVIDLSSHVFQGEVTRTTTWEATGATLVSTSANWDSFHNGAPVVDIDGNVVGLHTLDRGQFWATSGTRGVSEFVLRARSGDDMNSLGQRGLIREFATTEFDGTVSRFPGVEVYLIDEEPGQPITISVDSPDDAVFIIIDSRGFDLVFADSTTTGIEEETFSLPGPGPYYLVVGTFAIGDSEVKIRSTAELVPFHDPDEATLTVGDEITGAVDYPGDVDFYRFEMQAGEQVTLIADSAMLDLEMIILKDNQPIEYDDDSGGGLHDLNPRIRFRSDEHEVYTLAVGDIDSGTGGYIVTILELGDEPATPTTDPTATAWPVNPQPTVVPTATRRSGPPTATPIRMTPTPWPPVEPGDPVNGEWLFSAQCTACHSTGTNVIVGPGLAGIGSRYTALGLQEAILTPERTLAQGFPNIMPPFRNFVTQEELADLVAYLLTLDD